MTSPTDAEDRKGGIRPSRSIVNGLAEVYMGDESWLGDLDDLSIGGLLMFRPGGFPMQIGSPVEIEIRIPSEHPFRLMAVVARLEFDLLGVRFQPLTDAMQQDIERLIASRGRLRDDIGGR
jgi:hypothetical protein